ncbi:MAG: PAS domain-containing protein, partial [Bacteroidota bacterium]
MNQLSATPFPLDAILGTSALPIIVFDDNFRVSWINRAFINMTGIPKESWQKQPVTEILKQYLDDREYWAIEKLLIDPSQNKVETSFSNHFRKYFLWEVSRDHNIGYSL